MHNAALHAAPQQLRWQLQEKNGRVLLTKLHPDGGSLVIATVMEVDKMATTDLSKVLSARRATMKMLARSKTLREGSGIMVFSYFHPMAIVLH
jgi:hypothetical protein